MSGTSSRRARRADTSTDGATQAAPPLCPLALSAGLPTRPNRSSSVLPGHRMAVSEPTPPTWHRVGTMAPATARVPGLQRPQSAPRPRVDRPQARPGARRLCSNASSQALVVGDGPNALTGLAEGRVAAHRVGVKECDEVGRIAKFRELLHGLRVAHPPRPSTRRHAVPGHRHTTRPSRPGPLDPCRPLTSPLQ